MATRGQCGGSGEETKKSKPIRRGAKKRVREKTRMGESPWRRGQNGAREGLNAAREADEGAREKGVRVKTHTNKRGRGPAVQVAREGKWIEEDRVGWRAGKNNGGERVKHACRKPGEVAPSK